MVVRIGIVLGSLLIAVAVGLVLFSMLSGRDMPEISAPVLQAPAPPTRDVLIVTEDYSAGQLILGQSLQWVSWPEDSVRPDYYTRDAYPDAVSLFEGARARVRIIAGEPVLEGKVVAKGGGFLSIEIPPGKRAVGVVTSDTARAGGFILPGDYVDVVLTRFAQEGTITVSSTILTGVRVLAVGEVAGASGEPTIGLSANATLELWPWQAERLALAARDGEITLSLRSLADVESIAAQDRDFSTQAQSDNLDISNPENSTRSFSAKEKSLPEVYR